MTFRIKKGKHRAWPWMVGLWFNRKVLRRRVLFDITAKYNVGDDDTNKLFGIGYLWHHHKDSIRFGWRYDAESGYVIISSYCYDHGQRKITDLAKVFMNRWYSLEIEVSKTHYQLRVGELYTGWELAKIEIPKTHEKKWSYPLGLYFGGNRTAPHDISIKMKKV